MAANKIQLELLWVELLELSKLMVKISANWSTRDHIEGIRSKCAQFLT